MTYRHSAAALIVAGLVAAGKAEPPAVTVLLLDNQQVLSGCVEKTGDQFRVRREGGETLVPAGRVLAACADINAAYDFLRAKLPVDDPDARLRLARWCDANGLRADAAAEAKRAADLAPNRAVIQATYKQLQRKADLPTPPTAPAVLPASILSAPAEPVDCSAEAFKKFATKVQPILMNTCASCHAGDHAGKFRLERAYADGAAGRAAVQRNLTAATALVDRAKPGESPLLRQATTAHGGAAVPPLRDRGLPAFKQLEEWVKLSVGDITPAAEPVATPPTVVTTSVPAPPAEEKSGFAAPAAKKDEPTGPKDEFDPAIFNQQHHPDPPKP